MSERQTPVTQASNGTEREYYLGPVAVTVVDSDTGSWRVETPVCDGGVCIRCGICAKFCPSGIIEVSKEVPLTIDMRFCKGCGICRQVCPKQCIKMVDEAKEVKG